MLATLNIFPDWLRCILVTGAVRRFNRCFAEFLQCVVIRYRDARHVKWIERNAEVYRVLVFGRWIFSAPPIERAD